MGQLVMEFHGLCMHLHRGAKVPKLPVVHRVVAINAAAGYDSRLFGPLPPHHAFLMMDGDLLDRFVRAGMPRDEKRNILLTGARVEVANATGKPVTVSIAEIPRLTRYTPQMQLRSELAGEVLPESGDTFVETTHGTIEALKFPVGGGLYSRWTVETVGDPEIRITLMTGEAFTVPVPSTPEGKISIVLKNGTTDKSDKKFDFALHYLAAIRGIDEQFYAKSFPTDSDIDRSIGVDTTTSCSNSQYP